MPAIVLGALSCTGFLSTLCTAFYALVGMFVKGRQKLLKNANFCQILTFIYSYFCTLRMFLTFTYLFLVDVDLMTCMWTSPWIWFAVDATVRDFLKCFEKSLSGRNLLLTIQNLSLLPQDIRFSTK